MSESTITEAMVEAGARGIAVAEANLTPFMSQADIDRHMARACLEAALAVREGEDG